MKRHFDLFCILLAAVAFEAGHLTGHVSDLGVPCELVSDWQERGA